MAGSSWRPSMTASRAKINSTLVATNPSGSNSAIAAAVIATTSAACLAPLHDSVANTLLSFARSASTRPKKMVSTATIFGRKPEPGIDRLPVGRSPLSAMTSRPKPMKKTPATWSARRVIWSSSSSLHAADGVYSIFLTLGVDGPEFYEFGLIHISEFLAEIVERVGKLLAVGGLVESLA